MRCTQRNIFIYRTGGKKEGKCSYISYTVNKQSESFQKFVAQLLVEPFLDVLTL